MQSKIIEFLASFEDREYHEINSFMKKTYQNLSVTDIKQMLQRLTDKKRIEFNPNKSFNRWGLHTRIPEIDTEQNIMADYNNWPAMARLTWEELEKREEDVLGTNKNISTTNIQHIETNSGIAIQGAEFSKTDFRSKISPTKYPDSDLNKKAGEISIWAKLKKDLWAIFIGVIIILIGAYFVWKLGWS